MENLVQRHLVSCCGMKLWCLCCGDYSFSATRIKQILWISIS